MPIEIRELIIKATVKDTSDNSSDKNNQQKTEFLKEELITDCVDQVLEILQKKKER